MVTYDPSKVSYKELLDIFWMQIDPTDDGGQFADRGQQYESAIFYHSEEQMREASESKKSLENSGVFQKRIVTKILPAKDFYKAEEYHQDYYKKNSLKYKAYRNSSGRDTFLGDAWKKK